MSGSGHDNGIRYHGNADQRNGHKRNGKARSEIPRPRGALRNAQLHCAGQCHQGAPEPEIEPKAEIEEDKILLGKIANIKGEDPDLVQKLKEIVVGKAPLPGNSRQIDEDYVRLRLKQCGADLCQIKLQAPQLIEPMGERQVKCQKN